MRQTWRDLSIAKKLYFVVGIMAVLITCELLTLRFAMGTLSSVRAFVEGEGLWSKAQKNAALSLQLYGTTQNEEDFQAYLNALKIPKGDHQAREALMRPDPDLNAVRAGFLEGQIHPDDINPMIDLLRRFYWISYLDRAIQKWTAADLLLDDLQQTGESFHRRVLAHQLGVTEIQSFRSKIHRLNNEMSVVEKEFSDALGEGSRWLEHAVISILFIAVLMVESIGLTLTFLTSRMISRDLGGLNEAAHRIGSGDFNYKVAVRSNDEIGLLSSSVNQMGTLLQKSYQDLELRVQERTSELSAMAAEKAKLYLDAKEAVQVQEEFLSIASHELKTPLTSQYLQIQMLLRSIETQAPSHKVLELAQGALSGAKKLNHLIEELMDLTKLRVGKFSLKLERINIRNSIDLVLNSLRAEASKLGSPIEARLEEAVYVEADAMRVEQVVSNLVTNAIKYGHGKPVLVTLTQSEDRVRFSVMDQGPGISPSEQSRIFERFERVATDESIGGLGLGLYISRQIVEAHQGEISVESQVGGGAQFIVDFPKHPPTSQTS